jgi:hypothetical protein
MRGEVRGMTDKARFRWHAGDLKKAAGIVHARFDPETDDAAAIADRLKEIAGARDRPRWVPRVILRRTGRP